MKTELTPKTLEAAVSYTHTHTHTHTDKPCRAKNLVFVVAASILLISPSFSNIGANDSSASCDNSTIGASSGNTTLEAQWQANQINISWFNGNSQITPSNNAAGQCTYDQAMVLPSNTLSKEGYTFNGWKKRVASGGNANSNVSCDEIENESACESHNGCAWDGVGCYEAYCSDMETQTDCNNNPNYDCVWDSGICREEDCVDMTTQSVCDNFGGGGLCEWFGDTCYESGMMMCDEMTTQSSCNAFGDCVWDNGTCRDAECYDMTTESACDNLGVCEWFGDTCYDSGMMCEDMTTQSSCDAFGECEWDGSTCSEKQYELCWFIEDEDVCNGTVTTNGYSCAWDENVCQAIHNCTGAAYRDKDICEDNLDCGWFNGHCSVL